MSGEDMTPEQIIDQMREDSQRDEIRIHSSSACLAMEIAGKRMQDAGQVIAEVSNLTDLVEDTEPDSDEMWNEREFVLEKGYAMTDAALQDMERVIWACRARIAARRKALASE